jgi:hypothetical protein
MVTKCAHCGSNKIVHDGFTPSGNSVTGVTTASVVAATIHSRGATRKPKKNKSSPPMKNATVCAGWSASSGSRAKPSAAGAKKRSCAPRLEHDLSRMCPPRPRWNLITLVVRPQKEPQAMDLDCPVPCHLSIRSVRDRRPCRGDLPQAMRAHPCKLSCGSWLQRLLGGLSKCHPRGSAHAV